MRVQFWILILSMMLAVSCSKQDDTALKRNMDPAYIKAKLAKYTEVKLTFDRTMLTDNQLQVLKNLVKAAQAIDEIFWHQSYSKAVEIREALERSDNPIDRDYLEFLKINYGPFDRQDGDKPFIGEAERPPGAGFYPADLTVEEFNAYVEAHPEQKEALYKLNTLVRRKGDALEAVPYEEAYRPHLEKAAGFLREAARLTKDAKFKKYLNLRAEALLSGDFFKSDMAWMDLQNQVLDIVIGPIETYEDQLMGLKASYEGIVLIQDKEETKKLEQFKKYMNSLEQNLPVPLLYKKSGASPRAPIGVFNTVYTSGDANVAVKSIAFSLPNDERVRQLKGARTVQQKNIILAKFNKILVPISKRVLSEDLLHLVNGDAFFTTTLLHELAHPLGLNYVKGKNGVTVREALQKYYSPIEEAKADVVGLYNVGFFIRRGVLPADFEPKAYITFLASIFRSVRFGTTEAHAKANMITFNYLLREKAIFFDPVTGKCGVDLAKMKTAIKKLAAELLIIEGDGNYQKAKEWVENMGVIQPKMQNLLEQLKDIPVDVTFSFEPSLFE